MDIGAQLRSAREALGVSLALISQKTRVQPRIIAAIEHNDLASIPPRPFGRGFIRAYAREVGLDPDVTVQAYFAQFGMAAPVPQRPVAQDTIDAGSSSWPNRISWVVPAALLGLVGILALAISRGGLEPTGAADRVPTAAAATAPVAPSPVPIGTAGSPTPKSTALTMTLVADRECWVSASADGKRELYQLVQPGAEHTLRADREIAIRVGDAGAIRVGLNGKAPERFGIDGAVHSARFTPESAGGRVPAAQPNR